MRRVLNDQTLTWAAVYAPAVQHLLQTVGTGWLRLIVDESGHTDRFRVLMISAWYRGRAIPVAWVQWDAQTPQTVSYWTRCQTLLTCAAQVVPPTARVLVSADRAFGHPTFTDMVAAHGWAWVVRVQRQTCFRDAQGAERTLATIVPTPGDRWRGHGQVFKKAGWRTARVVGWWSRRHRESLVVVSSLPLDHDRLAEYQRRGAIESLFRDWKTAGWQWESSQVRDRDHHAVLLLGMAWATLIVVLEGAVVADQVLARPAQHRAARIWDGKHSLVRLGRDRIKARSYGTVTEPIATMLTQWDAPTWERQCRRYHAHPDPGIA